MVRLITWVITPEGVGDPSNRNKEMGSGRAYMRCKGAIDVSMKLSEAPQSKRVEMGKEDSKGTEMGNKNEEALDEQ